MQAPLDRFRQVALPRLRENRVWAALAIAAVAVSVGFWVWSTQSQTWRLRLGAGAELNYRKDLVGILRDEAAGYDLAVEVQSNYKAADTIASVGRGDLDAAIVPAGLSVPGENVRQVAVFDCEPLQLFVRPELIRYGVAALRGKRLYLGSPDSGSRIIAAEVLGFMGLTAPAITRRRPAPTRN